MTKLYTKNTWTDESLADAARYDILDDLGNPIHSTTQINLSTNVVTPATPVNAANLQHIEDGVDALDTLLDGRNLQYKITPSVASNNLTVALKRLDGTDPSATHPIYVKIGDAWRAITGALSVTANAGTGWFNAGAAELATFEIDYFVYLGYNATDGVVIGFSRIPFARRYVEFNATSTHEEYCKISNITNAANADPYEVIGRFAATLSAGAGFTWSVPTYTPTNLVQRPVHETRWLTYNANPQGFSAVPTSTDYRYKVIDAMVFVISQQMANGTSNATTLTETAPFMNYDTQQVQAPWTTAFDNGSILTAIGRVVLGSVSSVFNCYLNMGTGTWTGSAGKRVSFQIFYPLQ